MEEELGILLPTKMSTDRCGFVFQFIPRFLINSAISGTRYAFPAQAVHLVDADVLQQNPMKPEGHSQSRPINRRLLRTHLADGVNNQKHWNLESLSVNEYTDDTALTRSRHRSIKRRFLTVLNMLRFNISSRY